MSVSAARSVGSGFGEPASAESGFGNPRSGDSGATGSSGLARQLGTSDAVMIGLGSMIGAGVFAAFGPAARAAGTGLLIGLGIVAVIAYCNATASAQVAAAYPTSGGTYIYGRERLGHWWGFTAGWGFMVGKTASCAAMALTFATYAVTGPWWAQRCVAVTAVLGLTALNYRGVTKTALLTRVLVATSLTALAAVVIGIGIGAHADSTNLGAWSAWGSGGAYGILQAAPANEAVIRTWPGRPDASSRGTNARSPFTTPPTFTAMTRSHSPGSTSHHPGDRVGPCRRSAPATRPARPAPHRHAPGGPAHRLRQPAQRWSGGGGGKLVRAGGYQRDQSHRQVDRHGHQQGDRDGARMVRCGSRTSSPMVAMRA